MRVSATAGEWQRCGQERAARSDEEEDGKERMNPPTPQISDLVEHGGSGEHIHGGAAGVESVWQRKLNLDLFFVDIKLVELYQIGSLNGKKRTSLC